MPGRVLVEERGHGSAKGVPRPLRRRLSSPLAHPQVPSLGKPDSCLLCPSRIIQVPTNPGRDSVLSCAHRQPEGASCEALQHAKGMFAHRCSPPRLLHCWTTHLLYGDDGRGRPISTLLPCRCPRHHPPLCPSSCLPFSFPLPQPPCVERRRPPLHAFPTEGTKPYLSPWGRPPVHPMSPVWRTHAPVRQQRAGPVQGS